MKNLIVLLVTIMIFVLWLTPFWAFQHLPGIPWGWLYVPIFIISISWGDFLVEQFRY